MCIVLLITWACMLLCFITYLLTYLLTYFIYLGVYDVMWLDVVVYDGGDRLELTIVIVTGGAAARQRHERALEVGRVVEPGAVVVVGWTKTSTTLQLHAQHARHCRVCRSTIRRGLKYFTR